MAATAAAIPKCHQCGIDAQSVDGQQILELIREPGNMDALLRELLALRATHNQGGGCIVRENILLQQENLRLRNENQRLKEEMVASPANITYFRKWLQREARWDYISTLVRSPCLVC